MNNYTVLKEVSTFKLKVEQLARTMGGVPSPILCHFTLAEIEKELTVRAVEKFKKAYDNLDKGNWLVEDIGIDQYSDRQIEEEFIKRNHTEKPSLILSIGNGRTIFDAKGNTGAIHDRLVQAFTHDRKCCDLFADAIAFVMNERLSKLT